MFSILFYFFFFKKMLVAADRVDIMTHLWVMILSLENILLYGLALAFLSDFLSTTSCSSCRLSSITPVSRLCLRYDMFTLALGPFFAFALLLPGHCFPGQWPHCSLPISTGVLLKCFLIRDFLCAHPCILQFLPYITFHCSHI